MGSSFDFDLPDVFTAGTVGPPGERVFYLQARHQGTIATLKLEKQQVGALAEVLKGILEDLPTLTDGELPPDLDFIEPQAPEWVVASIGVGYDRSADRVLVVAEEFIEPAEADELDDLDDLDRLPDLDELTDADALLALVSDAADSDAGSARFLLTRAQVAAFVDHAMELVAGGRPPCPVCKRPLDAGRPCICSN